MLSDNLKQQIRQAYKNIGDSLENFSPRKQQAYLIAEISKTLAGEYNKARRIIALEAGTGTGKSLAYALGAIPLAVATKQKVCISTATVALQEQLIHKDLPFLKKHSGIDFSYVLVKGRQRYVCQQKLAALAQSFNQANIDEQAENQESFLFTEKPTESDKALVNKLLDALQNNSWSGDRDSWPSTISQPIWQAIQSDKHSCLRHLQEHQQCPFHKAREQMDMADVLVINHSLLLADLSLGGGKILPEPSECFYVLDEAHHLPHITRDHASASIYAKSSTEWLAKLKEIGDKIAKLIKTQRAISPSISLADDGQDILTIMQQVLAFIEANRSNYFPPKNDDNQYRFAHGIVPDTLKNHAQELAELSKKCESHLTKLYNQLVEAVKENEVKLYLAEPLLAEAGFLLQRLENFTSLWQMYAKTDSEKAAPLARWLSLAPNHKDTIISASPIEVGFMLEDNLWQQCAGAVLCSATIRALNSFDHFRRQVGLGANDGTQYQFVNSPFDYQQKAQLVIPNMRYEPSHDNFTDELIEKIPGLIKDDDAVLVLFSSYWQMQQVAKKLQQKDRSMPLLVQGEHSRQYIIEQHKKRIDSGKKSILFGTQSLSEGLDLPGDYLTHVVITKLPFSVPTSPVEEAQSEYISAKGGNPFMSVTVPEASKKLVQACGRLLRNEKDEGRISLLDRRVVSKRYGSQLLDSLPPFKRVIE